MAAKRVELSDDQSARWEAEMKVLRATSAVETKRNIAAMQDMGKLTRGIVSAQEAVHREQQGME